MTLDEIRSKPIVQLTKEEIGMLCEQEQGWVIAALARWDAEDSVKSSNAAA